MFTDTVGFTASTQTDEAASLKLLHEQREIVHPLFAAHQRRVIKSTGDGFLVEFDSALNAIQCAIDIQGRIHDRNARTGLPSIQIRIGIHLGDVEQLGGDILGDAVNIAARIEPIAEPGGICLSGAVHEQVRNKIPDRLEKLPPRTLKGLQAPVDVYRVILPWVVTGHPFEGSRGARVAVLPFVNMSPDPNDEFFADGMTEELIGKLSEIPDLKVIARTSVMNYKRKEKRLAEIGQELGVGSLIEGSVRRSGNRIRVTVQLVDARTEEHVWASKYDKDLDDIFAIQSDVASNVASSLERGVFAKASKKETTDVEAYTSYLLALPLLHKNTEDSLREALRLFERAVERDPAYARAYAGLARTWDALVMEGCEDWDIITGKAEPAARRALELDSGSAEAHSALAEVDGLLDRFEASIAEAERAIEINPNLAEAHETLGRQRAAVSGPEKGLAAFRRAYELDPLSERSSELLAWVAQLAGRETEAWEILERLIRLNSKDPRVSDALAEFYRLKGDFSKAIEILEDGLKVTPDDDAMRTDLGVLYAITGKRAKAEQILREAGSYSSDGSRLNARFYIHTALENLDEAFEALWPLAETHAWPFLIKFHPGFERLRKDPRFATFCVRVGLPA